MRLFYTFTVFVLLLLLAAGCSKKDDTTLTISVNPWIGYTPLFYIMESGWLDDESIRILPVVSLSESMKLMESSMVEGIGGTQQELLHLNRTTRVVPVLLLDRSVGSDALFANRPVPVLQQSTGPIDVYLERGSVNEVLLKLFAQKYGLDPSRFRKIHRDQYSISRLPLQTEPTIIVSYEPYLEDIRQNGYDLLATSAQKGLYIIDMLLLRQNAAERHAEQLKTLQILISRAVAELRRDPKGYYERVKPYLDRQSYEGFQVSLEGIIWLFNAPGDDSVDALRQQQIPTEYLNHAY